MQPAPNPACRRLVIIGASCRAAAQSALRAGWRPWCADLFADTDTAAAGQVVRVCGYPHGLFGAAAAAPAADWMYTGGLECFPRLVDQLARRRTLLGNAGPGLRAVRDPWQLSGVAEAAGMPMPPIRPAADPPIDDGAWLQKNTRSSGGLQVVAWKPAATLAGPRRGRVYFQQRIAGRSGSSVYLAAGGQATLIGGSWQLPAAAWNGAPAFRYAGSAGPIELSWRREPLRRLGERLAAAFRLQGLFGVDWIDDGQRLLTLEVNPRYTSSMELFERAWDLSLLQLHDRACRRGEWAAERRDGGDCHGKAVIYARRDGRVAERLQRLLRRWSEARPHPAAADIPAAAQRLPAGRPICTVLASGPDPESVRRQLQVMAAKVQRTAEPAEDAAAAADPRARRTKP